MKLPKSFVPSKNLDSRIERLSRDIYTIDHLVEERIETYNLERCEDVLPKEGERYISNFHYIQKAIKLIGSKYESTIPWSLIYVHLLEFEERAKYHLYEIYNEVNRGIYLKYPHKAGIIRNEFAIIILPHSPVEVWNNPTEEDGYQDDLEGVEFFKRHYRKRHGFS
ncbi:MAG: hypothetical protein KKA79_06520 [Nanoarchaeota archaeon]|nr:hypothetical protein [Nanoarchaeota archaeon]MCG2718973.1 hypothetical protein [Nanoarchaeota archaeon]